MVLKRYFLLFFCLASFLIDAKTIIWDCGGVLVGQDKIRMALYELGMKDLLGYIFLNREHPKKLQKKAFDVLNRIPVESTCQVYGPHGLVFPPVMSAWLAGSIRGDQIIEQARIIIATLDKQHYFSNVREKRLIERIIEVMFDPRVLVKYTKLNSKALELLVECANSGNENMILSNWDRYSFQLMRHASHMKPFFALFKSHQLFISGECGWVKPQKEFFMHVLTTYNLQQEECIFIDDQQENIAMAQQCGLKTYWFRGNYKDLRNELVRQGFLPARA